MVHKTAHAFGKWAMIQGTVIAVIAIIGGTPFGLSTSLYKFLNTIAFGFSLTYGQFYGEVVYPIFFIATSIIWIGAGKS